MIREGVWGQWGGVGGSGGERGVVGGSGGGVGGVGGGRWLTKIQNYYFKKLKRREGLGGGGKKKSGLPFPEDPERRLPTPLPRRLNSPHPSAR